MSPLDRIPSIDEIAIPENLFASYELLKRKGDKAPGIDLVRRVQLSHSEARAMSRRLSHLLLSGEYGPSADRPSSVPRDDGNRRPILIAAVADHVVAETLHQAIKWRLDRLMSPAAHAYRPRRGPLTAFAAIERYILEEGRYWIVTADIRRAYENVRIDLALADLREALTSDASLDTTNQERVFTIIERILRGAEGRYQKGLGQGNALANPSFNKHLSRRYDDPFVTEVPDMAHLRYSDNLTFLARSSSRAKRAPRETSRILKGIGLELKGDIRRANTKEGQPASILGLEIRLHGNQVRFSIAEDAWKDLEDKLDACYGQRDQSPNEAAAATATGFLGYAGPCLREGTEGTLLRIQSRLHRRGFGDVTAEELARAAEAAIRAYDRAKAVVLEGDPTPAGLGHDFFTNSEPPAGQLSPAEAPF